MATVYTRRLVARRVTAGGAEIVLYTHPGTGTVIVRSIVLTNLHTSAAYVDLYVKQGGTNVFFLRDTAFPASSTRYFDTRQELLPGESIYVYVDVVADLTVLITAYTFA